LARSIDGDIPIDSIDDDPKNENKGEELQLFLARSIDGDKKEQTNSVKEMGSIMLKY